MSKRILVVGVKCSGWPRPEYTEVEVLDGDTEEDIEAMVKEAAFDLAGIDFWIEEEQ